MRPATFVRLALIPAATFALVAVVGFRAGGSDGALMRADSFGPQVRPAIAHDTSPPLRELAALTDRSAPVRPAAENEASDLEGSRVFAGAARPATAPARPAGDRATLTSNPFSLLRNFDGITTAGLAAAGLGIANFAADASGAVGPNHYMQSVNFAYAIYDKTGTLLLGPTSTAAFWNGFAAAPCGGGWSDVVVLYDRVADRWFVSRFAQDGSTNYWYQCFAISTGPDPTGTYYRYAWLISQTEFNDYPKFGIWPDAYYMTAQRNKIFPGLGLFVAAFERDKMLAGQPAQMVLFTLNNNGNRAGMLPADWDGQTAPPAGSPNYLVRPRSSALGWPGADALEVWQFDVDWGNPVASTLAVSDTLNPTPYQPACLFDQNCIPQPNPATKLDPLASGYLMYRLAYRNIGGHETLLLNHTVDTGDLAPEVHAAVRWYELRRSGGPWSIYQEGDYAPDSDHRWIGSIAMDRSGDIALGYNVSSSTRAPSIAYAGQVPGDPLGTLSQESTLKAGGGSQTGYIFWSDYSQLTLDPTDDCTFWYVNSYQPSDSVNQNWNTRIGAFRSPSCPKATTSLTYTGMTTQDFNDLATLSATLTNTFDGLPVVGETLTFGLDGQSCMGITDAAGHASCTITPNEPAGVYPLTVSFSGTSQLEAANFNGNFTVTREETTLTYTGPTLIANGSSVQLSAVLKEDGVTPIAGRMVTFTLGSGPGAQSCSGLTNAAGVAMCDISAVTQPLGPGTVGAEFAGDAFYLPASDSASTLVFAFLPSGSFVVGDQSASGTVTFWSSDWSTRNTLSGGAAPASFKGYAATLSVKPPVCGSTWTSRAGNSANPPASVPAYMAVLVSSAIVKSGPQISGDAPSIVIVKTGPGYAPNPGHPGVGTVEATLCP